MKTSPAAKTSAASWRAFIASIVAAIHLPIHELARLTDRQLVEIYAHPRDESGNIKAPEEPAAVRPNEAPDSLAKDLRDWTILTSMLRLPEEEYRKGAEKLKAKWAAKESEGKGNG